MATSGSSGLVIRLTGRSYFSGTVTILEEGASTADPDGEPKVLTGWTNFKSEGKDEDTDTAPRYVATVTGLDLPNGKLTYEVTDTDTGTMQAEVLAGEPAQGVTDIFGTNPSGDPEIIARGRWLIKNAVTTTVE